MSDKRYQGRFCSILTLLIKSGESSYHWVLGGGENDNFSDMEGLKAFVVWIFVAMDKMV